MAIVESRSRSEWQDLDRDHYLHPFTDYKELGEKRAASLRAPTASISTTLTATRSWMACPDCGASMPATVGTSWSRPQQNSYASCRTTTAFFSVHIRRR